MNLSVPEIQMANDTYVMIYVYYGIYISMFLYKNNSVEPTYLTYMSKLMFYTNKIKCELILTRISMVVFL